MGAAWGPNGIRTQWKSPSYVMIPNALGPLAAPHIMEPRFEVHSAETARPNATIQHLPLVRIRVGQLRTVCIYVNSIEAYSETLPALDPSDQYQT